MKTLKNLLIISVVFCLTGCITLNLLDDIKADSRPFQAVWKVDRIEGIKQSTAANGEKVWTFVGQHNSYLLNIKDDDSRIISRNITTVLNNPDLDKQNIEFTKTINCSTGNEKDKVQNIFSCKNTLIQYSVNNLTETEKLNVQKALFLHDNGRDVPFRFTLAGEIRPKEASNSNVIVLKSPAGIEFVREEQHFSPKVFLLPFSVIGDIVTSPLQIAGYILIMNDKP